MNAHAKSAVDMVREYYRRIDANDTDWVLSLFAADAVYERADATYRGAEEIRNFFCIRRRIRGTHAIDHLWRVAQDTVVTLGKFEGVGGAGDPRSVGFADVWKFDPTGRIERRRTFLALGHVHVES